jgi:hypothetical protein
MKTTLTKVTGLALLAASFAFSGSFACANTEETTSIQILTFDAVGNPGEIIAALDCDIGDGMGNCPVETLVAATTAETRVADVFDPAELEAAADATADAAEPAIQPVDAIIVTGDTAIEGPATSPSAETATEDETTGEAPRVLPNKDRFGEASTAIAVEVMQSSTVAAPGQAAEDEPVVTGSFSEPSSTTPVSMFDSKHGDEDF